MIEAAKDLAEPLAQYLIGRIKAEGPLSVADYMAEALGNQRFGYYMTREPFGQHGDFVTAPEVSQMFGELIGLWVADYWLKSGTPERLALIELGPGRGTLMADALRAIKAVPGLSKALRLHLVEMSPRLRDLQKQTLPPLTPDIKWHGQLAQAIEAAKGAPLIIIANEFFDALPIHQLVSTASGWHERLVGLDEAGGNFTPLLAATPSLLSVMLAPHVALTPIGSLAEICPAGLQVIKEIASALEAQGGAALIIDYGTVTSAAGDSLQALTRHQYSDPFKNPGQADITAHVDFAALGRAASSARTHGPVTQARFLENMGINARAQSLKAGATEAQAHDIDEALKRLTDENEMGSLFKVLGLTAPSGPLPAGFEDPNLPEDK
jgi:NADH dehydrogenase [ubiquinone] 1 alpha subcomplex assembly factor 7